MLLGGKVYVAFGNCLIPRTVVGCLLSVIAYIFSMNCVAVLLILLALVLHMIGLLFVSSPLMESFMLVIVHPSGKMFCTVLNVIIVPIIIFFFGSVNSIVNLFCSKSIGDCTFSTANLLSELICVRDGLRDIAINFT